jgi:hypothetical protein
MVSPRVVKECQSDAKRVDNARQSDAKAMPNVYILCS